jgi:HSP20 family protein
LTLTGERKLEKELPKTGGGKEGNREGYHRVERFYGSFTRSFALPNSVVGDQVSADLSDGVLTVTVPKKAEVQPKRIEVKSGSASKPVKPS